MSTPTIQISYTPESEVLFRLFHNEVASCKRPYRDHSHAEYEITIILAGHGTFTVGKGKHYDTHPGDVFLFRSNENHYMSVIEPGEDARTIGIHFLPQFIMSQSSNLFDIKFLAAFLNQDSTFENRMPRNNPVVSTIVSLMEQMKGEYDQKLPDYEQMIKIMLLTILMSINRSYGLSLNEDISHLTNKHFDMIAQSMKYIDEHIAENLSLEKLADMANVSRSYYSRIFKIVNRIPPMDYIIRKRIDLAKVALQKTDLSILEIAYQCGFNNTANFNRAFRQRTGLVPSAFRKQARKVGYIEDD